MKRIIATTLGVILTTATLSAFAAKQDRESLAQCKADITSHFGDGTRTRLRSIKRTVGETHLRIMVRQAAGNNALIVCSVSKDGVSSLADRDGIALAEVRNEQKISFAK